jgi:hypothetical protein
MGLLAMLTSLKALEAKNIRDYYVATIMLYFFSAIVFAYNNSAFAPIFLALFSTSITTSLILLSSSTHRVSANFHTENNALKQLRKQIKLPLKQASKILAQALPITIVLFFLFPRIQGTFGFLPNDPDNLNQGLSNGLEAGSFSERAFSNELAFRVNFEGVNKDNISVDKMYWRVKTFSQQLGFRWEKKKFIDVKDGHQANQEIDPDNSIKYLITHQSTSDKQLPSLAKVVETQAGKILNNHTIQTNKDSTTTFQYSGTSILNNTNLLSPSDNKENKLSDYERNNYLETLFEPRNKTRQLLNKWLNQVGLPDLNDNPQPNSVQAKQLALSALRYFREEPFKYNLLPPNLDQNEAIEDFLFRTRSGYCEHYASTFSTLMRWMNIPTRVVAGFQGAEYNAQGNFYEIRYSNAHAWSEIWTNANGWIRADPTAAVAPERIEFGVEALLSLMQQTNSSSFSSGDFSRQKLRDALNPSGSSSMFKFAGEWLNSTNHSWDKWIVNYSFEQQTKLLKKLGLNPRNQHLTLLGILGLFLSIIIGVIVWLIWPKKIKREPIDAAFYLFKKKLRKAKIATPINEGPNDLKSRIIKLLPNNSADINYICQYYVASKYNTNDTNINSHTLDDFIKTIKRFKPQL